MRHRNRRGPMPTTGQPLAMGFPALAATQSVCRGAVPAPDGLTAGSHAAFLQITPRGRNQTQPDLSAFAGLRRWRARAYDFERARAVRSGPAIAQPRTRDFG